VSSVDAPIKRAALKLLREIAAREGTTGTDIDLGYSPNYLGSFLLEARRPAEAEPMLREALAIRRAAFDDETPQHDRTRGTAEWLAACLLTREILGHPLPDGAGPREVEAPRLCEDYHHDLDDCRSHARILADAARRHESA